MDGTRSAKRNAPLPPLPSLPPIRGGRGRKEFGSINDMRVGRSQKHVGAGFHPRPFELYVAKHLTFRLFYGIVRSYEDCDDWSQGDAGDYWGSRTAR